MKRSTIAAGFGLAALTLGGALAAPPQQAPQPVAITVFDQANFKGRAMTFQRSVPSLAAVNFNDLPLSVKIEGPRDWVLCEHRNFMGTCVRVRAKEKNLKRLKIDGKVSSLYPVRDTPPASR